MEVEIGKWGNSLALRIPAIMAKETGLTAGTSAQLTLNNGVLTIVPNQKKLSRKERYARILTDLKKNGPMEEIPSGPAQGNESIEW